MQASSVSAATARAYNEQTTSGLRPRTNGQFAQLNANIDGGFAKIESRLANVDAVFANVDAAFESHRAETALQLAKQTRAMVITLIGLALSVWIPMLIIGLS